ncbi:MAG TPA: alpha/beta fold hydrolase [Candidatus Angelobacter sp.]|jgi:homoserine O-acetyltransferase|nr:alpha/beta fold hydrolase [Candidatus Angelobacter sp.]
MKLLRPALFALFALISAATALGADYPPPQQGNFVVKDFQFKSGERMAEVKLHYYTLGTPQKDAQGTVRNAVLILHGTGGAGTQFLSPNFAGVLFGPGQLLDATKYFIVLPDNVGHGQSSKPSDGQHMRFPHYEYDDMIELQYRMLTQGLGVNHLRLVMGTSMGGMHTWLWGEQHPDFMDALMPLASQPIEIAGRNRMTRKMIMDAIRTDPEWNNGEYTKPPHGLACALDVLLLMGSSPLQMQKQSPTREKADAFLDNYISSRIKTTDANDMLYYFDASRNYNPEPQLEKITAPLTAINSADDLINPPELKIIDADIHRVKKGKLVVLPITDQTRGHGTHSLPAIWQDHLVELLKRSTGAEGK